MNDRVVADAHIVTDHQPALLVGAMQHRAVLDVHPVADAYAVHIATHHGIVPHATVITHDRVTDHHGGLGQETILAKSGCEAANATDQRHRQCVPFAGSLPQPSFWQQAGNFAKALGSPGVPSAA